jgi:AhpD family alkylhydroperoxidase
MGNSSSGADRVLRHYEGPLEFASDFAKMMAGMSRLRKLRKEDRIDSLLAQKVMLAVVGVNECECCSYNHTLIALEKGIGKDEIDSLLAGTTGSLADSEIPAVLYSQHWADAKGHILQTAREKAVCFYGEQKVRHIEALARLSEMTSLCNNTVAVCQTGKGRKGMRLFLACLACYPLHAVMKHRYDKNRKAEGKM